MTSSKKVDPILSASTMGDFKKRFITSLSTRDTPSSTGDEVTPPLLSLHYTILVTITTHNTAGFGLGAVFVPFADADVVSWSTAGNASVIPALIE